MGFLSVLYYHQRWVGGVQSVAHSPARWITDCGCISLGPGALQLLPVSKYDYDDSDAGPFYGVVGWAHRIPTKYLLQWSYVVGRTSLSAFGVVIIRGSHGKAIL